MRKITLNPDELAVESFDTVPGQDARGTVQGQDLQTGPNGYTCQQVTCDPPSCPAFSCISQCPQKCFSEDSCTNYWLDGVCH